MSLLVSSFAEGVSLKQPLSPAARGHSNPERLLGPGNARAHKSPRTSGREKRDQIRKVQRRAWESMSGGGEVSATTWARSKTGRTASTCLVMGSGEKTWTTVCDSVTGAGLELWIVQHEPESSVPASLAACPEFMTAIIGQSGGQCMEAAAESGMHNAIDRNGSRSTAAKTPVEMSLCRNPMVIGLLHIVPKCCDRSHSPSVCSRHQLSLPQRAPGRAAVRLSELGRDHRVGRCRI